MTNIGYNPTLNAQTEKRLEVHIIGFNEMIYGDKLELSFSSHYDNKEIERNFVKYLKHDVKSKITIVSNK